MNSVSLQNRKIIGEAYTALKPQLFSIFRQAAIEEHVCHDLTHDVFLKMLDIDIISSDSLQGLAVTIAYQKRTDYLRHRTFINKVQAKGELTRTGIEQPTISIDAEKIRSVELRVVRNLRHMDSITYSMSRFEDMTADEIAQELHISKRAVEGRLYRTRGIVREKVSRLVNF